MLLDQIGITNFRCFETLEVKLDQYLNVFVGRNGGGKTTLLDAIALVLAPLFTRLPFEKKEKVPSLAQSDIRLTGDDRSAPFSQLIASTSTIAGAPLTWGRIRSRDNSPSTKAHLPAEKKDLKELHHFIDTIVDAHNAARDYRLPVFAYYGTNRAVNVPHYKLRKQAIPKRFQRLAGLENALQPSTDFRRAISWFDFFEQRELREQRDKAIAGSLPALECIRTAITQMIPEIRNPRIDGETGRFTVDTNDPANTTIKLHLDQLSDGYQVMLGVVMDFALRLALANPPDKTQQNPLGSEAILIIDEVDLHIHPAWQQRLIPDLRRTFPNTQLILTTHSPQVATTVPSNNLRILSECKLHTAPAGTEGAESQRLLKEVFGVEARPNVSHAHELTEYLRLVDERKYDSPRAKELRLKLDAWSDGQEPRLAEADLKIANLRWEAGE